MSKSSTGEAEVLRLRRGIETQMRRKVPEAVELVLEEELTEALGMNRYERGKERYGILFLDGMHLKVRMVASPTSRYQPLG